MIDGHEKFRLENKGNTGDLFAEINYSDSEDVQGCKMIRFTLPDGTRAFIETKRLQAMIFAISDREAQEKMIPVKTTRSRWYETTVSVKAKSDIKKGEEITFPIKLTLPTISEEVEGGMRKERGDYVKGKSSLYIPKTPGDKNHLPQEKPTL